jgi:hypothetical protein
MSTTNSAAKILGTETVWVIMICFFGVIAYVLAMCWLLCCAKERKWGPAENLPTLQGDLMFVIREPNDENNCYSQEDEPKIPSNYILGKELSSPTNYGRIVVIKGSVTFIVWNKSDEDTVKDDDTLEKLQVKAWLHPEAYGSILPHQKFRIAEIDPGTYLFLEEYRLPTEQEKIEHAAAVAEAEQQNKPKKN